MTSFDFSNYTSPFSWRYGSEEMRKIFSEENKYLLWRKIWVALAKTQHKAGLVSKEEFEDLKKNQNNLDIQRILEIEKETKHDVVAAIKEFAEKAKVGGGKIHLGATSYDIVDNAVSLQIKQALQLVEKNLIQLLSEFAKKAERYANFSCIGYTHLQPAEPTTVGYRLAFYAQDLLIDYQLLQFVKQNLKSKGLKGAVGTSASYQSLLGSKTTALEKEVMENLGLDSLIITSQISTKKIDYLVFSLLNSIASSCAKFANDLRFLQSAGVGEWSEPFGKKQVGSSAMPFKKNPVSSEKIVSLARYLNQLPEIILANASYSYLERTLDDSANRRVVVPEGFLALDEILITMPKLITGLVINEKRIAYNLLQYAPFAATEPILTESVKNGANRQEMHEVLRQISLKAWADIQDGKTNPMQDFLLNNDVLKKYLKTDEIKKLLDVKSHIGDAPDRTLQLVKKIKETVKL